MSAATAVFGCVALAGADAEEVEGGEATDDVHGGAGGEVHVVPRAKADEFA